MANRNLLSEAPEALNSAPRYVATDSLTTTLRDCLVPEQLHSKFTQLVTQLTPDRPDVTVQRFMTDTSASVGLHWISASMNIGGAASTQQAVLKRLSAHLHRRLSMWTVRVINPPDESTGQSGNRNSDRSAGNRSDRVDSSARVASDQTPGRRTRQSNNTPRTLPRQGARGNQPNSASGASTGPIRQLQFTFGGGLVDLTPILVEALTVSQTGSLNGALSQNSDGSDVSVSSEIMRSVISLKEGWYAVNIGPDNGTQLSEETNIKIVNFMAQLGVHLLTPKSEEANSQAEAQVQREHLVQLEGIDNGTHMPQCMQLHNMILQQLFLPKSKLVNRSSVECERRFETVSGAISQSVASNRARILNNQLEAGLVSPIADLFVPYDVSTGESLGLTPGSSRFTGDLETFASRYLPPPAMKHCSIVAEGAVRRLRFGHDLLKHSLLPSIRSLSSNPHGGNFSTMNFLWQQRARENSETPEANQQVTQDPLTMAYDDEELDILLENNPMGIWPVTMTRPLSKIKLGRLKGRHYSETWYQKRWQYIPVVFEDDQPVESQSEHILPFKRRALNVLDSTELEPVLLAATQYAQYLARLEELEVDQAQLSGLLANVNPRTRSETARQAELQTIERDIETIRALRNTAAEVMESYGFSWAPIWTFRDHISTSMRSEGEAVQAHTVWTATGSKVHEQLFCNVFFGFNRQPEKIKQTIEAVEASFNPEFQARVDPRQYPNYYAKGRSMDELFVSEFVRPNPADPSQNSNRMRCQNFADSYTYPLDPVQSAYQPPEIQVNQASLNTTATAIVEGARIARKVAQNEIKKAQNMPPERANRYHWANPPQQQTTRRVQDSILLDYTENVEEGLKVALNHSDAKAILFPKLAHGSRNERLQLQTGVIVLKHVAPEYPVLWPFGLGSGDQNTDPSQKASGYETRVDSVCVIELRDDADNLLASTMVIVEYKMRMEMSTFGSQFTNDQQEECFRCLQRDVKAAQHYHSTVTSLRSQLQAESNAWMVYLNTGVLPSHCIIVNGTRRLPAQPRFECQTGEEYQDNQAPNRLYDCVPAASGDTDHECAETSATKKASQYVCGEAVTALPGIAGQPKVPCCLVAISQFDARKPYLLDMLNAMATSPFRSEKKQSGFNSYLDRHLLLPTLAPVMAYTSDDNIPPYDRDKVAHLRSLATLAPTCELSRALVAALVYSKQRFEGLSLMDEADAQKQARLYPMIPLNRQLTWTRLIAHPANQEPLDTSTRYQTFKQRVREIQNFVPSQSNYPVHIKMYDPKRGGQNPQTYSLPELRNQMTPTDAHLLSEYLTSALYNDDRADNILAAVIEPDETTTRQVVVYAFAVSPVDNVTTEFGAFHYIGDPSGVQASSANIGARLFRRDVIVPKHRRYPMTELEVSANLRKEMNEWVHYMAQALITRFEMANLSRNRPSGKARVCGEMVSLVEDEELDSQAEILNLVADRPGEASLRGYKQLLKEAASSALASMDAEDFFGLTLLAGHRQQLQHLATDSAKQREYTELVTALKRALCKLHARVKNKEFGPSDPNNHWHWNILSTMAPGETFDDLNDPAHNWNEDQISYGDMHSFGKNNQSQSKPSEDDLDRARPSKATGLGLFGTGRSDADVQKYVEHLAKHKAVSIVRMVNRVFNARVLAAVSAIAGEQGVTPLVDNYEAGLFDPHSFSHMSQRAYWAPGVRFFCEFRAASSTAQAVQPPYWLAETFKHCVKELMTAATFLPKHGAAIRRIAGSQRAANRYDSTLAVPQLRDAAPDAGYPYRQLATDRGIDVRVTNQYLNQANVTVPSYQPVVHTVAAASQFRTLATPTSTHSTTS